MKTRKKVYAWSFIWIILIQTLMPVHSYALTGGPSQPEIQSFEPAGTSEMVDLSSGSFTYNILLMDIGGYPLNIAYHSGITMDQEGSWVGLGWNINPGVINRNMRGLPDDFSGDAIKKEFSIKPNTTYGGTAGVSLQLFGNELKKAKVGLGINLGVNYNTYVGLGMDFGLSPTFSISATNNSKLNLGLGINAGSRSGVSLSPSMSFSAQSEVSSKDDVFHGNFGFGGSLGCNINSRTGLSQATLGLNGSISREEMVSKTVKKEGHRGVSTSANFSFASPTYTPTFTLPYVNSAFSLSGTVGLAAFGTHPSFSLSGYYNKQELATNSSVKNAYGSLYTYKAEVGESLMDFNREKDGPISLNTPNLALATKTPDTYSVSAQGTGGSYKINSSDVGVYSDPDVANFSNSLSAGVEFGGGPASAHVGGNFDAVKSFSYSGNWRETDDNEIAKNFRSFNFYNSNNLDGENPYFTAAGEMTIDESGMFYHLGQYNAVRPVLDPTPFFRVKSKPNVVDRNGSVELLPSEVKRTKREKRNSSISFLTAKEATHHGLEKSINWYKINEFINPVKNTISRTTIQRKGHHVSELTSLRSDGMRYVFGIPAYNTYQEEVSFSVNGDHADCNTGKVGYTANVDNSTANKLGKQNYYSKIETPPYAHSFLLNAVLSKDYVDKTNDGPSTDDIGSYTHFKYSMLDNNYNWRVPVAQNMANYNPGYKSLKGDDQGNYLFGSKEVWYVHKIESKTEIAEFYISKRDDGLGVVNRNGGVDGLNVMYKLDSIKLYSRPDRLLNKDKAVPIKTVHFEYDYSLCQGITNTIGSGGKLTLKKLWFTYGKSKKGKLSPYSFTYANDNPSYDMKAYSRWGTYQPSNLNNSCDAVLSNVNNTDFPYVIQDKIKQDEYAKSWNLTKIELPSGGAINVEYESGDYAYIQNKKAMQMYDIEGMFTEGVLSNVLDTAYPIRQANQLSWLSEPYEGRLTTDFLYAGTANYDIRNVLAIKLKEPIPTSLANSKEYFKEKYLGDILSKKLYFKTMINLAKDTDPNAKMEFVTGYTDVQDYGLLSDGSGTYKYAYIKLEKPCIKVFTKKEDCNDVLGHPFAVAAWNFTRLNLPKIAFGETDINEGDGGAADIIGQLAAMGLQMGQFFKGFNKKMRDQEYAKEYVKDKTWIRLYEPTGSKLGGAARVKKVEISDEWATLAGTPNSSYSYGQEYEYTKIDESSKDEISSGVASYEPMMGGDENPHRWAKYFYSEDRKMAPSNEYMQEAPFGESLFPSPSIVYSKVTVSNLKHTNVERTATGKIVHEYYTAKDFPTRVDNTGADKQRKRTGDLLSLLKLKSIEYLTVAQGYAIINNDMHGKPKKQHVYDENGTQISSVNYYYKTNSDGTLYNTVNTIDKYGNIKAKQIGVDMDMTADSRESGTNTSSFGVQLNFDGFLAGLFPVLAVVPLPSISSEKTRFRSMQLTKTIYQYGILDRVVATDHGASVSTDNLAWDAETGEVLVTRTYNEHKEAIYFTKFPAHWAYEGMQAAYQNIGALININAVNGISSINSAQLDFLTPGDELAKGNSKIWVKDINKVTKEAYFIDQYGDPVSNTGIFKIIRSGHRNMQSTAIGSITSLENPIVANKLVLNTTTKVLDANAVEYSDDWQTYCCEEKDNILRNRYQLLRVNVPNTITQIKSITIYGKGDITFPNGPINIVPAMPSGLKIDPSRITEMQDAITNFLNLNGCPVQSTQVHSAGLGQLQGGGMHLKLSVVASTFNCDGQLSYVESNSSNNRHISLNPINLGPIEDGDSNCNNDYVNPYLTNNKGQFRPLKPWLYLSDREQGLGNQVGTNIRKDGAYTHFSSFWNAPATPKTWEIAKKDWVWSSMVTKYSPDGSELENRDTLNRFSAETLGFGKHLVTAVAANSKYNQIAFDGFEDYLYEGGLQNNSNYNGADCCPIPKHFDLLKGKTNQELYGSTDDVNLISRINAHTGKYSLNLQSRLSVNILTSNVFTRRQHPLFSPFELDESDCVGIFSPDEGQKYVISLWVKSREIYDDPKTYTYNDPKVTIVDGSNTYNFTPSGPIIEGWQKIYGEFSISVGSSSIELTLEPGTMTFFDDLRIHPFDASYKSYVYDDVTLKLSAELDNNNFAAFYEYDGSGALVRIKKETIKGISTIQDTRSSNPKN